MNFTNTVSERELGTRVVNLNKDELVNRKLNLINGKGGLVVRKRGCDEKELKKEFGDCVVFDVTHYSKSEDFKKFCPQYIHYGIPVPYSEGVYGNSVEGIWEGLKDIKGEGIDKSKFKKRDMNGLSRMVLVEKEKKEKGKKEWKLVRCGNERVLGIRKGVNSDEILSWEEGRKEIYIECYNWVLKNKVYDLVRKLRIISKSKVVVLLDMVGKEEWNGKGNIGNGYLIKKFIEEEMS